MKYDFKKTIVIPDPPSKYVDQAKRKIDPETGKLKEQTFYLSANLFFGDKIHYHQQKKVMDFAKNYLTMYFQGLPKLEKLRIKIIYERPDYGFDLDNKAYFWLKTLLDLLKQPTERQLLQAKKKGYKIITLGILTDDNVQVVDKIQWKFKPGPHKMTVKMKGRKLPEQRRLFI